MRSVLWKVCVVALLCGGCSTVDVTKTSKGYVEPTNPNDVQILETKPDRPYEELGTVSTTGWSPSDTAKLHNALRDKAAPLGANAVIIVSSGMTPTGAFGSMQMWS